MQLGCAPHLAVFHVGDDDRPVIGAFFGVTCDETVVQEAVEPIVAALWIEPQQVVAQQRQLFVLAQRPHIAKTRPRAESVVMWHVIISSWKPSRRRRIPSALILCIAAWNSRLLPARNIGSGSD